jgi:hypothetical protein
MNLALFPNPLPASQDPVVNPATGAMSLVSGRNFFQALWSRTGGGDGIIPSIGAGLTAIGNSQTTALVLKDDWNEVDTVGLATPAPGVQIPPLSPGQVIAIFNGGVNPLNIYPFGGGQIDALGINAAYPLAATKLQIFWVWSLTQLRSFGRLQNP